MIITNDPTSSPSDNEMTKHLRVLVVDDKAFVRTMTGRVLQAAGIEHIAYAGDGKEAITTIQLTEPKIDLVLCDLMMPDMDGVEVVRHVAELPHKPVFVFISGANVALLGTAVDMARARGLHVLGAIEKPISVDAVRGVLTKLSSLTQQPNKTAPQFAFTTQHLVEALEKDQFILHYQPKINLKNRGIDGFEALIRWIHPQHGLIPPSQFIALAEESEVIKPLTDHVLMLALKQVGEWKRAGLVTKVSVNVSAHLLVDLSMPDRILQEVVTHGVDPNQIVLEITETGVFRDAADTLDILARLHMKGFALSIDDFGTGYSSMEQLRRVPFAELKIDRAFVNGASQNMKSRAILQSSAALGRSLGITVVAEGAETTEDWDLLDYVGVDVAQGFYAARPMPGEDVITWSRKWLQQVS